MTREPDRPRASHYTSPEVLSLERERMYSKLWVFAGFAQALHAPNACFARRIAGMPVLLQQTGDGLRAFVNQCAHRGMPLQPEGFGNRALVCPYHGWSFDSAGRVNAIPDEHLYGFRPGDGRAPGLIALALRQLGVFVFVNFSADPIPIESQFDPGMIAAIEDVSRHLDREIIHACFPVHCNWKLNMENVKDGNHVRFVHDRTFFPSLRPPAQAAMPAPPTRPSGSVPELASLSYSTSTPIDTPAGWWASAVDRYGSENAYYNWFLFPNVNLASVNGLHFLLQQFDPVSPGRTDFHLWMMTARRQGLGPDMTALLRTLISAERAVIEEDVQYLEGLQSALGPWSPPTALGSHESALADQHRWYAANVLGGPAE